MAHEVINSTQLDEETAVITFAIGDLAQQLNVTPRTIRYYEERGLIRPLRSSSGQRVYSKRDRGRLKLILRAKKAGFDLEESRAVLDLYDTLPSDKLKKAQAAKLEPMLQRRIRELDEQIAELSAIRQELADNLAFVQQDE